jgi:predicted outer membrane repeat protein
VESHIDNNTAGGNGGGIANGNGDNTKHDPYGQNSIENNYDKNKDKHDEGTVEIVGSDHGKDAVRSTLSDNKAGKNGGGLFSSGGFVTITFTAITGNTACENGGGIYAENTALKLDHVLVAKNHADGNGGGIVNTGGKHWGYPNDKEDATATISDSTIVDNTANRFGGGIFNGEWLVKVEDGFTERNGKDKDDNATLTLRDTEIKNNTALNGGGIFNNKGKITLTKTHVTKNTATDTAKLHRVAGGILNNEGKVKLDDKSTITNNDPTNCANTVEDCFN